MKVSATFISSHNSFLLLYFMEWNMYEVQNSVVHKVEQQFHFPLLANIGFEILTINNDCYTVLCPM